MLQFIIGLIVGTNVSLILYVIILGGKDDEWYEQNWILCYYTCNCAI